MSRFAIDPRWLLYLPPTMSPVATSARPELLEHPDQAFDAFRADGVEAVVCEEKHMGSRAVALVCPPPTRHADRFGMARGRRAGASRRRDRSGVDADRAVLLRPGADRGTAGQAASRRRDAAGLFDELSTGWLLLDAELMPWSAKAEELLRNQYAAVGAAARARCPPLSGVLEQAARRGLDVAGLLERTRARAANAEAFSAAYRRYCWPTDGLDGVRLAPFQLLAAAKGRRSTERPHAWHLDIADRLAAADPGLDRADRPDLRRHTDWRRSRPRPHWWEELTASGGEGMVVKPAANLVRGRRGPVQPGLKVRGREYLRIIYGPDYTEPANLDRLRKRGLGHKRSLARASTRSASRRWTESPAASRCGGSTSVCSPCSRSSRSQWIPACEAVPGEPGEMARRRFRSGQHVDVLRGADSFSTFGHTDTLTSPRCALRSSSISVRDWPMPPPTTAGSRRSGSPGGRAA